jgi:hypothetical protein
MCENNASRIVIDDSRGMLQIVMSLTDDYRDVIHDCNMFIVQATGDVPTAGKVLYVACHCHRYIRKCTEAFTHKWSQ